MQATIESTTINKKQHTIQENPFPNTKHILKRKFDLDSAYHKQENTEQSMCHLSVRSCANSLKTNVQEFYTETQMLKVTEQKLTSPKK